MPSKPKDGYPVANNRDQNTKPINTDSPSNGEATKRHPANIETGTRQSQSATDYVAGQ